MSIEELKRQAAEKAVEQVKSGMIVGLGTGSSAKYATIKIGELWQTGQLTDVICIPTSESTVTLAAKYGLPLATLAEHSVVDLAIDGADEIDPQLNLIKGMGGALLREKMIESASEKFIVVADGSKLVEKLGTRSPVPVEVVQFCWQATARWLESLGCEVSIRGSLTDAPRAGESSPFVTDNGNYILDCGFPNGLGNPVEFATAVKNRPGVVEHGLFLGVAAEAIVATETGLQLIQRVDRTWKSPG